MTVLGDLVEIYDGPHATPTRRDSGPYFLNISSLKSGRLDLGESDHVSEEDFIRWTRRMQPRVGDLLFSYETRLGEAALMPDGVRACLGRRMGVLRPDRALLEPRYLLYYFLSPLFQELISERTVHGATVPRLLLSEMASWPVDVPDLATQTAIADVLGALDDKIAASERVLASALAVARLHFAEASREAQREWLTYDDVVEVQGGGTPRTGTPEYWGGPISWATPTDVTALTAPVLFETSRTITEVGLSACASQLHQPGSILMTSRATIGAFAWAFRPVAVNQGFIVAKAKNPMAQLWLFFEMQSRVDDYLAHANGATFLELSRATFKRLPVAWPSDTSVFDGFNRAAQPLLELTAALAQENERLAATRDALLPELMSGRLAVNNI